MSPPPPDGSDPAAPKARAARAVVYSQKPTAPAMPAVRLPSAPVEGDEEPPTLAPPPGVKPVMQSSVRDRAALLRLDGASDTHVVFLPKTPIRVGRARDAELRVDDDEVSRAHAEIRFEAGRHVVVDLDSRNGTWVHGESKHSSPLHDGDIVQFGSHATFRYTLMDERQETILRRLYESSTRDSLTGAYNRRYFDERLRSEVAYALRHKTEVSLLMFDLDLFKRVNDTHGHQAGDAVLAYVSAMVTSRLRAEDVFARYGGEEFAVVLRGNDVLAAARAGERLRGIIAGGSMLHERTLIPLTISVGCAALSQATPRTADALVALADERLYTAKAEGRNRVVSR